MPTAAHRLARARALESMVRDIARAEIRNGTTSISGSRL